MAAGFMGGRRRGTARRRPTGRCFCGCGGRTNKLFVAGHNSCGHYGPDRKPKHVESNREAWRQHEYISQRTA